MSATAPAALSLGFAFPAGLRTLEMRATPGFRQDASVLHLTLEAFEYKFE
ncbi:MAG: hypothetical protein NVS3B14_19720 [Ktedonobacteraceae bacterium]